MAISAEHINIILLFLHLDSSLFQHYACILGSTYFVLLLVFLVEDLFWEAGCWVHLRAHTFSPGKIILPKKA